MFCVFESTKSDFGMYNHLFYNPSVTSSAAYESTSFV